YHDEIDQVKKINYLFDKEEYLDKHDVVISNFLQRATIVGEKNIGKVLSLNFTKVKFLNDQLDKRYFLYLFNNYKDIQRQKERELQGTGLVLRLTKKSLEKLIIPVVSLTEQQRIGEIYIETLKLQSKLNEYARLTEQFAGSILEKSLEG
ncbi:restriction endonuclease subunit S, partial [Enterococcus faecium]|nr:restriction endonuclease subunit S [Enterococcus faecium]